MASRTRSQKSSASRKGPKSKQRTPSSAEAAPSSAEERAREIALDFHNAIACLSIAALEVLCASIDQGVTQRQLVNFLRGNQAPPRASSAQDQPALDHLHGQLSDFSSRRLGELITELVEEGYCELEGPHLRPTPAGARLPAREERLASPLLTRPARLGKNPELEASLTALRKRIASEEGRPSFSVFDNTTLANLAACRPQNLAELALLPGFGEARLRRYGRRVLRVLKS